MRATDRSDLAIMTTLDSASAALITVVLADTGQQDPGGKVHLLGAGWHRTSLAADGTAPPQAVAVFIEVPAALLGSPVPLTIELVDQDGNLVPQAGHEGHDHQVQPMRFEQPLTTIQELGAPEGEPGHANVLLVVGGVVLRHASRYDWRVSFGGRTDRAWQASFATTPFVRQGVGFARGPASPTDY